MTVPHARVRGLEDTSGPLTWRRGDAPQRGWTRTGPGKSLGVKARVLQETVNRKRSLYTIRVGGRDGERVVAEMSEAPQPG